ncbi:hypothetical protein [Eubacterium sp.]|uniref:hypothetical protein n=1 Tax=Eubacterium sp. TaxID=142586 RepID=UPI0026E0C4EF|nr:hypothetical protein [Eubacterium sp.]MDO5433388.1 hypothetical protein [Eubacterium sp.]
MFDTNLTIYNIYRDYITDKRLYYRTNLYGVNWQGKSVQNLTDKEIESADYTKIYIPEAVTANKGKVFCTPEEWSLKDTDRLNKYTFQKNDIVVPGDIAFDITGEEGAREKDIFERFPALQVFEITTCFFSSKADHWMIGAK